MKGWDLSAGSAKLELGLKVLKTTTDRVGESWNDATYRNFVENYISTLDPQVKALLDSVRRLAEVLSSAEREVRDEP
jgi:hypothetical protein